MAIDEHNLLSKAFFVLGLMAMSVVGSKERDSLTVYVFLKIGVVLLLLASYLSARKNIAQRVFNGYLITVSTIAITFPVVAESPMFFMVNALITILSYMFIVDEKV